MREILKIDLSGFTAVRHDNKEGEILSFRGTTWCHSESPLIAFLERMWEISKTLSKLQLFKISPAGQNDSFMEVINDTAEGKFVY